jgi:serine acetyltransferase
VTVGANAVVVRDVPAGLTVLGVPTHHYGQHKQSLMGQSGQ